MVEKASRRCSNLLAATMERDFRYGDTVEGKQMKTEEPRCIYSHKYTIKNVALTTLPPCTQGKPQGIAEPNRVPQNISKCKLNRALAQ